jgi:hypothetical protein
MGWRYRSDEQIAAKVAYAEEVKGYSTTALWFILKTWADGLKTVKDENAGALIEMKYLEHRLWLNRLRRNAAVAEVQAHRDHLSAVENELNRRKHEH